ncbi:MAG: hypothetical protein ACRC2B_06695 [Rubrivivax sp.]
MQQPLANRVDKDADPTRIAAAVLSIWEEIDDALTPIVGSQGVVALYRRSLHLAVAQHPWLAGRDEGVLTDTDPAVLKSVLAQRSSAEAAAGGSAFLNTFHELLASLIGPSLTARLLRSVWEPPSSGAAAQDTTP